MTKERKPSTFNKTTTSFSDVLMKAGMNALVPGAGFAYEVGKVLIGHAIGHFEERTQQRIHDFHASLLRGEDQETLGKFLKSEFDIEDYHKLLSCCVNDIENEKTELYSTFFKNLILSECSQQERRHFTKALNDLTFYDTEFLRRVYINQNFKLMTDGGEGSQLHVLSKTKDTFQLMAIRKASELGILTAEGKFFLTELGLKFIKLIYPEDILSPESIGIKPYSNIKIGIISCEIDSPEQDWFSELLERELWNRQIKSFRGSVPKGQQGALWAVMKDALIFQVGDKGLTPPQVQQLSKVSKHTPLIRFDTTEKAKQTAFSDVKFLGDDAYFINISQKEKAHAEVCKIFDEVLNRKGDIEDE